MTNNLDSRALGRADCFGQRFMRPGDYAYGIVPAYGAALATDSPFLVRASEKGGKREMAQQNVVVSAKEGRFSVDRKVVEIDVGDMVMWNGGARGQPFAVVGEHDFFSSHRMVNECGYSHAFGTAGDYRWTDAHGSGLSGRVRVRDPGCRTDADLKRWRETLAQGTLVTITDGKADQGELEILTGQTVFFLVVKGPGISVTDERLIEIGSYIKHCTEAVVSSGR
jgi:plastocyanin